jgi:thioredoxin 1
MNQTATTLVQITDQDFDEKILNASSPVLVDFWAEWCAPCRALGPVIESLSEQYRDKAVIAKVDVDSNQKIAMKFGIRSIPTVILFDGGEIVETFIGVRPRSDYEASLDRQLSAADC